MKKFSWLVALLAVTAVSAYEDGKGDGSGGGMRQACGADVERLCPGSPKPGECLHEHWDEVSPGCKEFKENMRRQWQAKHGDGGKKTDKRAYEGMRQACGADVDKFCAGATMPGVCLHEHWDELSPECRRFKEGMKRRWEAQKQGDEKPGGEMRRKPRVEWSDKRKEDASGRAKD